MVCLSKAFPGCYTKQGTNCCLSGVFGKMRGSARGPKNIWVLVILLILGGLAGSLLGQILGPSLPLLKTGTTIGLSPGVLNLHFMTVTFGFSVAVGPLTLLGFVLGYFIYARA